MDPIDPILASIARAPAVERIGHRVDPEQQKREQERRRKKEEGEAQRDPEAAEGDDGLPHIDVSV